MTSILKEGIPIMIDPLTEHILNELLIPSTLYHASPNQGLKLIDPSKTESTHLKVMKAYVYGTDDKSYSAGFSFNWSSRDGFKYGQDGPEDPWLLQIPRKYINKLKLPCSIYELDTKGFKKLPNATTPEYYNVNIVRVLKEEKYRTVKDCLDSNEVKIKII